MKNNTIRGLYISLAVIIVALCFVSISGYLGFSPARAMLNPAAVYCEACGYTYLTENTPEGEVGFCQLPDNQKVDAWEFYKGKVALDWSYCAQQGYEAKHVEESDMCWDCTVCVLPNGSEMEVSLLMELSFEETTCGDGTCGIPENYLTCPEDCPSGSFDGYCDRVEDGICDPDCESGLDPDCGEVSEPDLEPDKGKSSESGVNWGVILGIIAGCGVILVCAVYIFTRRRNNTA
jgi:putative hemolysin